ncbi:hypothetical protein [Nannocystis pusilla]|uniref:hypothetical protein n=1 Tax=Nannocystis pusilla TaxID=889268 RepID=UPI003B811D51
MAPVCRPPAGCAPAPVPAPPPAPPPSCAFSLPRSPSFASPPRPGSCLSFSGSAQKVLTMNSSSRLPFFHLTVHLTLRIERSIACLTGVHTMPSAVNA